MIVSPTNSDSIQAHIRHVHQRVCLVEWTTEASINVSEVNHHQVEEGTKPKPQISL